MPNTLKNTLKKSKQRRFFTKLGYDLEQNIDDPHPTTHSFPLHEAVMEGRIAIVRLLIRHKANLNNRDEHNHVLRYGKAPLLLAISEYKESIARLLLKNGADPNKCDERGTSPLIEAADKSSQKMVARLLEAKADINQENMITEEYCDTGMTAVLHATLADRYQMVSFLLERGAKITNSLGSTLFDYCCSTLTRKGIQIVVERFMATTRELATHIAPHLTQDVANIVCSYTPGFHLMQLKQKNVPSKQEPSESKQKEQTTISESLTMPCRLPSVSETQLKFAPGSCWATPKNWAEIWHNTSSAFEAKKDSADQRIQATTKKPFAHHVFSTPSAKNSTPTPSFTKIG